MYDQVYVSMAIDNLFLAIAEDPDDELLNFALGSILMKEQRYGEAVDYFLSAHNSNPVNKYWHQGYANSILYAGYPGLAIQEYQELLQTFPEFIDAYYELAYAYFLSGEMDQAQVAIVKALDLSINYHPDHLYRAGVIFEGSGEIEDACRPSFTGADLDDGQM